MKTIISQNEEIIFTVGENCMISVTPVEDTGKQKNPLYSIGVGGISMGIFSDKEKAVTVLKDAAVFLSGREVRYTVPSDKK